MELGKLPLGSLTLCRRGFNLQRALQPGVRRESSVEVEQRNPCVRFTPALAQCPPPYKEVVVYVRTVCLLFFVKGR